MSMGIPVTKSWSMAVRIGVWLWHVCRLFGMWQLLGNGTRYVLAEFPPVKIDAAEFLTVVDFNTLTLSRNYLPP